MGTSGQLGDLRGGVSGVRVEIRAAGEDGGGELSDFFRWLKEADGGPDEVRFDARPPRAAAGGGGSPQNVVDLALTPDSALAGLAALYVRWRDERSPRPAAGLTFTRADDGLSVTVGGESEDAVRHVLTLLAAAPAIGGLLPGFGSIPAPRTRGSRREGPFGGPFGQSPP